MKRIRRDYLSDMDIYPYTFDPIFKNRIWGGRKLESYFGKALPPDARIGESWELSDLPEGRSRISNGPLTGITLAEAIEKYGEAITGKKEYRPPFPLLIKLLDASDVLSVQVHPDAETCKRMGKGQPKTECWYIIDAEPGAVIYKGLVSGTTRAIFAAAIAEGRCAEYLNKVVVQPGECHFLPAGTCHAIGPGLLIAEIQQPSDTTYRVFDWNRVDPATGEGRELHVDEALESIHFGATDEESVRTMGRLVNSDAFKIAKGRQMPGCAVLLPAGEMRVLVFVSGKGQISTGDAVPAEFAKGDTVLVPAAFEGAVAFSESSEYLIVTL